MTEFILAPRSPQQAVTVPDQAEAGLVRDRISIRAMTVDDGDLLRSFFRCLSPLARYRRFMSPMRDVPNHLFEHLSRVDQTSHVAYLGETIVNGRPVMIAEARYVVERHCDRACDFAIAVADPWQGHGLGKELLSRLEQHAVQSGRQTLAGDTLPDNRAMIGLAKRCGFAVARNRHDPRVKKLTKKITT